MQKVKMFTDYCDSTTELEDSINTFLSEKDIISIQTACTKFRIVVVVIYEE